MGIVRYIYVDEVIWDYPRRNTRWIRSAKGMYISHEELVDLKMWERVEICRSGVYDYSKVPFILDGAVAKVIQLRPTVRLSIINKPGMPKHMRDFTLYFSKIDNYSFINPSSVAHNPVHYISIKCHNRSIVITES